MLAMYLMKYAGMSVGIFERRHEIGGAWPPRRPRPPVSAATPMPTSSCPCTICPSGGTFRSSGSTAAAGPASMQRWICLPEQQDGVGHLQPEVRPDAGEDRSADRPLLQERCEEVDKVGGYGGQREYWRAQADMLYNPAEYKIDPAIAPGIATRQIEFFRR